MRSKGRPPTRPIKFMNGFYIEVRNKGSKERGVKIRSVSQEAMELAARHYERSNKEVVVLGECKDEIWLNEESKKPAKAAKTKKAKVPA